MLSESVNLSGLALFRRVRYRTVSGLRPLRAFRRSAFLLETAGSRRASAGKDLAGRTEYVALVAGDQGAAGASLNGSAQNAGHGPKERKVQVKATVGRFWMVGGIISSFPTDANLNASTMDIGRRGVVLN